MSISDLSFGQAKHTLEIIEQRQLNSDDMRFLHDGYLSDVLEGVHYSRGTCMPTRDELRVFLGLLPQEPTLIVNYDLSIKEMVSTGKYDRVIDNRGNAGRYKRIRAGTGIKKIKIRLECLVGSINLAENGAEEKCSKRYRLASYEEIFAFGATFPKVQCRCAHGIFGKAYGGISPDSFQPNLWGGKDTRGLSLEAGGIYSNPYTHFLLVER